MQAHRDSCKHKHITLAASVYYAQTHLPNPALSSALSQRASGFKNKWRAWPFIMFRTLFFLRLECGQECVVALLALRGRKTYHAILLQKKEERCRKTGEGGEAEQGLREREESGPDHNNNRTLLFWVSWWGVVNSPPWWERHYISLAYTLSPCPSLVFITAVMMLCAQARTTLA